MGPQGHPFRFFRQKHPSLAMPALGAFHMPDCLAIPEIPVGLGPSLRSDWTGQYDKSVRDPIGKKGRLLWLKFRETTNRWR